MSERERCATCGADMAGRCGLFTANGKVCYPCGVSGGERCAVMLTRNPVRGAEPCGEPRDARIHWPHDDPRLPPGPPFDPLQHDYAPVSAEPPDTVTHSCWMDAPTEPSADLALIEEGERLLKEVADASARADEAEHDHPDDNNGVFGCPRCEEFDEALRDEQRFSDGLYELMVENADRLLALAKKGATNR